MFINKWLLLFSLGWAAIQAMLYTKTDYLLSIINRYTNNYYYWYCPSVFISIEKFADCLGNNIFECPK